MSMLRNVFAVICGIAAFVVLIGGVEWLSHQVYPQPADIEFDDPEQTRAFIATLPIGAILFIGLAWAVGAAGGTVVATLVGTLKPLYFGLVIGGLVLAGSISMLLIIPHPVWFTIAGPIGVLLATYAAIRIMERLKS